MPRPGPRRPSVSIRMSEAGRQALDDLAVKIGLVNAKGQPNRSELARRVLRVGLTDPTISRKVREL